MEAVLDLLPDPVTIIRSFFILASAAVLAGSLIPSLHQNLFLYGPRQSTGKSKPQDESKPLASSNNAEQSLIIRLVSLIPDVPHRWFFHFYVLSVASSLLWIDQLVHRGSIFQHLVSMTPYNPDDGHSSMSRIQVFMACYLMGIQGVRRLAECLFLSKTSSTSKMPLPHYVLGLGFYLVMGVAIWIEGIPSLIDSKASTWKELYSVKTYLLIASFYLASAIQTRCHRILAELPKYTLPEEWPFRHVLSPHYTAECFIYLALAVFAAPEGQLLNKTIACALVFVAVNLGVTAQSTQAWYLQKFGTEKVGKRWKMVPYVY